MLIEKTFEVDAPQQVVWAFITVPEKVAECVPGCQDVEQLGDNKYKAAIKVQVGPIKTTFNVNVTATELQPPNFSLYETTGSENGQASKIKATTELHLKPLSEAQTQVIYRSEVTILGRLGKFGEGIMRKKADAIGEEFVEALCLKMNGEGSLGQSAAPLPEEFFTSNTPAGRKIIVWVVVILGVAAAAGFLLSMS